MPSAAARRFYEDQIPSFMSVFDLDTETMEDSEAVTLVDPKLVEIDPSCAPKVQHPSQQTLRPTTALPPDPTHRHQDSTSTQNSESADSSPTTTLSTTDTSSLSDPSPSSSPDSPVNLVPLSSYPATSFGGLSAMANLPVSDASSRLSNLSISDGPTLQRPMTSPSPRKPRNMKGLSIQPPFMSANTESLASEPSSPSFIKPAIPAMKRKPSQLSLKTSTSDLVQRTTLEIPSTPSLPPILQRRALKHSTSSPHMLSGLKSASFGPAGGMTIPTVLERNESGLSELLRPSKSKSNMAAPVESTIHEEHSPIKSQVANCASYDVEPYHENENNEDSKSPGYPEGPIAIYDDDVFLYLEPTAEEAAKFDVVINVAREVKNPFEAGAKLMSAEKPESPEKESPIPDTAVTNASFATAFEFQPSDNQAETPTTPKAVAPPRRPEYIHMPWDHNTDIAEDLMNLCEVIESRRAEGKRVLIHCQQGASRSASLIIAYGLYQRPELSVNDAYNNAQARSRWISPNMRLMYCLQDFHKNLSKKTLPASAYKPRTGRSPSKHRTTASADAIDMSPKEPLTAPLPGEDRAARKASPERSPLRARGNSSPESRDAISPGPSSAPSSFSWKEKEDVTDPGKFGRFNLEPQPRFPPHDVGFGASISLPRPPPSPGFPPSSFAKPPPTPGFAQISFPKPPPSPGFAQTSFPKPPPSPGFGGFGPDALSKPPPSLGLAPISRSKTPPSPGLGPAAFPKPQTSPGFAARRFGGQASLGFAPLTLASRPAYEEAKEKAPVQRHITVKSSFSDDAALMSPRVERMTNNPLHQHHPPITTAIPGMSFVEVPPTPSDGIFSPRETMFPREPSFPFGRPSQVADPRSPPTKGETPITRSIDDIL